MAVPLRIGLQTFILFLFYKIRAAPATTNSVRYVVQEECQSGTFIGNPLHDANVFHSPANQGENPLFIKLMFGNKDEFHFNETTGDLHTNGRIDRESLCDRRVGPKRPPQAHMQKENTNLMKAETLNNLKMKEVIYANLSSTLPVNKCKVELSIVVRNSELIENWINVHITVQDIDDNAPRFTINELNLTLSELTPVGASIQLAQAIDEDEVERSILRYGLVDQSSPLTCRRYFSIFCKNSVSHLTLCDLNILTLSALDYESCPKHFLVLFAEDSSHLGAVLSIHINVKNENEHTPELITPQFDALGEHKLLFLRNSQPGTVLTTIYASDEDSGEAGRLIYSIAKDCQSNKDSKHSRLFHISKQGMIVLRERINDASEQHIRLPICIHDNGKPVKSATAVLHITLIDHAASSINIFIKPLGGEPISDSEEVHIVLPNAADIETLIALIWATSSVGPGLCRLKSSHLDSSPVVLLDLVEAAGLVMGKRTFALKIARSYNFKENFKQMGNHVRNMNACIVCEINSIATETKLIFKLSLPLEKQFRFPMQIVSISVEESARPILGFYRLTPVNSVGWLKFGKTYSGHSLNCEQVVVNTRTGWLSFPFGIDREESPSLQCTFYAVDNNNGIEESVNETQLLLQINITDINDCAPALLTSTLEYGLNISEYDMQWIASSTNEWTRLLTLQSIDADAGDNGTVFFELVKVHFIGGQFPTSQFNLPNFRLASYSGELSILTTDYCLLDRESVKGFILTVKLSDLGTPFRLTELYKISVYLLDVNDNKPVFLHPFTEEEVEVLDNGLALLQDMPWYASLDSTAGFWTKIRVSDPDWGENGTTTLCVVHRPVDKNQFALNRSQVVIHDDGRLWINLKHLRKKSKTEVGSSRGKTLIVFLRASDNGRQRQLFTDAKLIVDPDNGVSDRRVAASGKKVHYLRDFNRRHASRTQQIRRNHSTSLFPPMSSSPSSSSFIVKQQTLLLVIGVSCLVAVLVSCIVAYFALRKK